MIIFELICEHDHRFEGWFKNGQEFDKQLESGLLTCPTCGTEAVRKLPTASRLNLKSSQDKTDSTAISHNEADQAYATLVRQLHDYIMTDFDDVGSDFASETRRIHYENAEPRNLRGTATLDEILELDEEGIKTFYIPDFPDKDKMN